MGPSIVNKIAGASLLAGMLWSTSAAAGSIDISFTAAHFPSSLHIDYGPASGGGFEVTNITGGIAIFFVTGPYSDMGANNIVYEASPFLDNHGIGIDLNGGGDRGVIYFDNGNYYLRDNFFFTNPTLLEGMSDPFGAPPPVTPGVPEPSTWAMMILGLAGLGLMGVAKRSKASVAA